MSWKPRFLPGLDRGVLEASLFVPAKRTAHPNLILAICCTSLLIVGMEVTIINVALPAIQKDLLAGLQWILGYAGSGELPDAGGIFRRLIGSL
jgi:hypothetical protein